MSVTLINSHVLIPDAPNWKELPAWKRTWETEVADGVTGAEKRAAMRQTPRIALSWQVAPQTLQLQNAFVDRLRAALKSGHACAPYWGRGSVLAAAVTGTSVSIEANAWPWAVGDYLALHNLDAENPVYNIRQVTAISGTTLTLDSAVSQTFATGGFAWPMLFGTLTTENLQPVSNWRGTAKLTLTELKGATVSSVSSAPTYLSRPIFTFPINWAKGVNTDFEYDLRKLAIGFGAEQFAPLQTSVTHGFDFNLELTAESDVAALDNFTAALRGRLTGFWLPAPMDALQIAANVSATQFDIKAQGLVATFADHPAQYLYFTKDGQTPQPAKMTAVTDNGDGTERVTVDASVSVDASWGTARLHYVRLAADDESGTFVAEGWQRRPVKVVELPTEYAAFETGESPIYLYHFWANFTPVQHWYYTSFASDISSNGNTYSAKSISHGEITEGVAADREEVKLSAFYESGHPLALGFPYPSALPVNVEIFEAAYATPDTTKILFSGQVEKSPRKGKQITATAATLLDLDGQRLPGAIIGPRCNFHVYDADTCGVDRAAFERTGCNLDSISDRTIRASHATALHSLPTNWFAFGWIETGTSNNAEIRTVLQSTAISDTVHELILNYPLAKAVVNQSITLLPGCDGRWVTCQSKFLNDRAMLHPYVPQSNPTLSAIDAKTSQGGKK